MLIKDLNAKYEDKSVNQLRKDLDELELMDLPESRVAYQVVFVMRGAREALKTIDRQSANLSEVSRLERAHRDELARLNAELSTLKDMRCGSMLQKREPAV